MGCEVEVADGAEGGEVVEGAGENGGLLGLMWLPYMYITIWLEHLGIG